MSRSWSRSDLSGAGTRWECSETPVQLNVVFVHGFKGHHLETWSYSERDGLLSRSEPVHLATLLQGDPQLPPVHYFSISHGAGMTSLTDIGTAAGVVRTFVRRYVEDPAPVVFVAHSFGGLACRAAILGMLEDDEEQHRVLGLLMLGTPNSGTEIARLADWLGSSAGSDMKPFNKRLADLNRRWTRHFVNEGDPDLEATLRAPLLCVSGVGTEDQVVPEASAVAMASFSEIETLTKDHTGVCKARDRDDITYRVVRGFVTKALARAPLWEGQQTVRDLTHRLRQASLAGRWVQEEEEHITLEADQGQRYRCRVLNRRRGGIAKKRFNFLAWLPGQYPDDEQVDFDWVIGRGILSEDAFAELSAALGAGFDEFFQVGSLRITQGGRSGDYELASTRTEPGWVLLEYQAPEWVVEGQLYDELELGISSFVDYGQGWYFYYVPRTVGRRLEVRFTAPFRARSINNLAPNAEEPEPIRSGDMYLHRFRVKGSIPMGRSVVWVYPAIEPDIRRNGGGGGMARPSGR